MYELDIPKQQTGVRVGRLFAFFLRFCKKSPLTRGAEWDILNKLLSGREGFLPPTQKYLKKELDKLS